MTSFYSENQAKALDLAKSQIKDGWVLEDVLTYFLMLTDDPFLVSWLDSNLKSEVPVTFHTEPSLEVSICRAEHYYQDR